MDQSGSMLSEDVAEKGYALLCVSQPMSDCKIKTIPEVGSGPVELTSGRMAGEVNTVSV